MSVFRVFLYPHESDSLSFLCLQFVHNSKHCMHSKFHVIAFVCFQYFVTFCSVTNGIEFMFWRKMSSISLDLSETNKCNVIFVLKMSVIILTY